MTASKPHHEAEFFGPRRRLRLPIAAVLVAGFGTLTLLAVAAVLILGLLSAGRNTYALLNDKADLALKGVVVRVRHQLDPAYAQAAYISGLIEGSLVDPADEERLTALLTGALAATPQVSAVTFTYPDMHTLRVARVNGMLRTETIDAASATEAQQQVVNDARQRQGPYWSAPLWSEEQKTTVLRLRSPVRRDGEFMGVISVSVGLGDLSRFLSELFVDEALNAFVLFDRQHVLAHQNLRYLEFDFSRLPPDALPLPRIEQVDDPILAGLSRGTAGSADISPQTEARLAELGPDDYLFLLRPLEGYGTQPWIVGISFRLDEITREVQRLWTTGLVGLAILLVSVAAALLVGRAISRQIGSLANAAATVGNLDFRLTPVLPDSRFREIANAADAFNSMVAGLRWFEAYVPKKLVLRLMRHGSPDGGATVPLSEERQVTVMFTDIRGFTSLAEDKSAAEVAALLNQHFGRISACIEAEGGTVDKFIGDAVMAFWGAPELQEDHASRAVAAARRIAETLAQANARRRKAGEPPVRLRIGLHTGAAVVGNIGSANRLNYTIVGDTVNIAQRIEELASRFQGEDDLIVLASAATATQAGEDAPLTSIGRHTLRGRVGTVELFRLVTGAESQQPEEPAAADR